MSIIYLISSTSDYDQQYKIGYTKNLKSLRNRELAIKTGNPGDVKVIEVFNTKHNRKVEIAMQNRFKTKQINREWFELELEDINNFIKNCETIEKNYDILLTNKNPYY